MQAGDHRRADASEDVFRLQPHRPTLHSTPLCGLSLMTTLTRPPDQCPARPALTASESAVSEICAPEGRLRLNTVRSR
jgi:hypothetical protein